MAHRVNINKHQVEYNITHPDDHNKHQVEYNMAHRDDINKRQVKYNGARRGTSNQRTTEDQPTNELESFLQFWMLITERNWRRCT